MVVAQVGEVIMVVVVKVVVLVLVVKVVVLVLVVKVVVEFEVEVSEEGANAMWSVNIHMFSFVNRFNRFRLNLGKLICSL